MNNKEKHTGVSFHKSTNKWTATISYNKKQYHLGYFSEKQDAIDIRKIAEQKIKDGDFLKWYNDYKSQKNSSKSPKGFCFVKNTNKWKAYIAYNKKQYILGHFETMDDAIRMRQLAEQKIGDGAFLEWYNDYKSQKNSSKSLKGICFVKNTDKWKAYIVYNKKQYTLGRFETMDEAIEIRKEAELHKDNNDFLEWYNDYKTRKNSKTSKKIGVFWVKHEQAWKAEISYHNKVYYLGKFETEEDAIKIRIQAETQKENGNFLEWYKEYFDKIKRKNKAGYPGVYKDKTRWRAEMHINKVSYSLGSFKTKEKAIEIKKIAEKYHKDGMFLEWYNDSILSKKTINNKNKQSKNRL